MKRSRCLSATINLFILARPINIPGKNSSFSGPINYKTRVFKTSSPIWKTFFPAGVVSAVLCFCVWCVDGPPSILAQHKNSRQRGGGGTQQSRPWLLLSQSSVIISLTLALSINNSFYITSTRMSDHEDDVDDQLPEDEDSFSDSDASGGSYNSGGVWDINFEIGGGWGNDFLICEIIFS